MIEKGTIDLGKYRALIANQGEDLPKNRLIWIASYAHGAIAGVEFTATYGSIYPP